MAGHVDHGKTALVEALTGVWLDRSPEEKRRGMTIELGLARAELPGGGEADIIDVPGHETLVHTMVRGAATIDCGLLVVAADDGPMPQTREHLAVLGLLGVPSLVVALTKADLVDKDLADLAEAETRELLERTPYAASAIIRVCASKRTGIDRVRECLAQASAQARPRALDGAPRIPIDRVFSLRGQGTVVTGTVMSGTLSATDDLTLEPGGVPVRVRSMQRHQVPIELARPGDRVALNLADIGVDDITRGTVIARAGTLTSAHRMDVRIALSIDATRPLKDSDRVRLHILGARAVARVRFLEGDVLRPGQTALAQLTVEEPIVAAVRDRFVLRTLSPAWTIGGGVVLDAPVRRVRGSEPERIARLILIERAIPAEVARAVLSAAGAGVDVGVLAARGGMTESVASEVLDELVAEGAAFRVGDRFLSAEAWTVARDAVVDALEALHAERPTAAAHPRETVKARCGLPDFLADAAIRALVDSARIEQHQAALAAVGWTATLDPKTRAAADELLCLVRDAGRKPTRRAELEDRFYRWPPKRLTQVIEYLVTQGELVRLRGTGEGSGALMAPEELTRAERVVLGLAAPAGFSLADLRDALGVGRHPAQWLAEHFDAVGVTRRVGEPRVAGTLDAVPADRSAARRSSRA